MRDAGKILVGSMIVYFGMAACSGGGKSPHKSDHGAIATGTGGELSTPTGGSAPGGGGMAAGGATQTEEGGSLAMALAACSPVAGQREWAAVSPVAPRTAPAPSLRLAPQA